VLWIEYVLDVDRACKDAGLYTVMVTNGYITPAGLDLLGECIDVWRVDVKAFSDHVYRKLCKVRSVRPVLDAAERAQKRWGMHVEVVTNVIPTVNDDDETLAGIAGWIASALGPDTPWHVTRFFPYLELDHLPPTPLETLERARQLGADAGLHFVFVGNVDVPGGEDTVCPECGEVAIARRGYTVVARSLGGSSCARCGTPLGVKVPEDPQGGRQGR
jgi:pyruvate formate lyase activating enzyme